MIHMGISVRGALSKTPREFARLAKGFTREDGGPNPTVGQVRDFLLEHLSQGHELIPFGECDNWCWKSGCKGHPDQEPKAGGAS